MSKVNIFRGPAAWTLAAGVAIGAGSMYYGVTGKGATAIAQVPAKMRPIVYTNSESAATLKSIDDEYTNLAEYAGPAVVLIKSESKSTPTQDGMVAMPRGGEGSGVIFRKNGYIITNDHVVGGFDKVTVVLHDGREFPGKVIRAEDSDIAVVKIEADDLPTLPFADSSQVKVGQIAMAIGAPFGLENSVTFGHVSAVGRTNTITDPQTGRARFYADSIQTDAAINMGNSGGPLIDREGRVIGINSSILSPNGTSAGIGFSISSNQALMLAETLISKGKITRSFMGIAPDNLKEYQKKELNLSGGAIALDVPSDGPAAAAGLKKDDVIVKIGTVVVNDQLDLRNAMLKYAPGTEVNVEVVRDGAHKTFNVKLTEPKQQVAQVPNEIRDMPFGNGQGFGNQAPDFRDFMKKFGDPNGDQNGWPSVPHLGGPKLGVNIQTIDETAKKTFKLPTQASGVVVTTVTPGSIADKLGLQPGDMITELAGTTIHNVDDIKDAMSKIAWGDSKQIKYSRFSANSAMNFEKTVVFNN